MIQIESKNVSLCDWSFFLAVDNLGFFNELFISECVAVSERSLECMCVCVCLFIFTYYSKWKRRQLVLCGDIQTHMVKRSKNEPNGKENYNVKCGEQYIYIQKLVVVHTVITILYECGRLFVILFIETDRRRRRQCAVEVACFFFVFIIIIVLVSLLVERFEHTKCSFITIERWDTFASLTTTLLASNPIEWTELIFIFSVAAAFHLHHDVNIWLCPYLMSIGRVVLLHTYDAAVAVVEAIEL